MKNKYIIRGRISEGKFREIVRYFSLDIEASKVAKLCNVRRPCVNRIFKGIRQRIAKYCELESPFEKVEI